MFAGKEEMLLPPAPVQPLHLTSLPALPVIPCLTPTPTPRLSLSSPLAHTEALTSLQHGTVASNNF